LLFNLTSEEKNVGQKYRYFPSLSSFNKLKKILLNATPLPAISVSQCYTEFREVLPKLRNGFVVRKLIHGKDLEKN
jgi:hypothetical protein